MAKVSNARGMPGGGMLKLRFDRYITRLFHIYDFYSMCSLITVKSVFLASHQAFGLLDAAKGTVYCMHTLRFLTSVPFQMESGSFAYTEVYSPT